MSPATISDEHGIALGVVAGLLGAFEYLHQATIDVLTAAGADALRDDGAARVLADVDHLGAGVGLLHVVGQGYRVELPHRVIALKNAGRVLPGDGRASLDLGPTDVAAGPATGASLGNEVVDAAAAFLVAGIPVLDGGVLDGGILEGHQFHHRGVKLILVAHRRGAPFKIADVASLVGDDERPLELTGVLSVYAEIGAQLHRAAHAFGNVDKRAIAEHCRVEGGEIVVRIRHDRSEIFAHQFRMLLHRVGYRAEYHASLRQLRLEGRGHGDTVENRIHRHPQPFLFSQRNTELLVGLQEFRIDLVEAGQLRLLLRGRIVAEALVVDGAVTVFQERPGRFGHGLPVAIGL